MNLAPVENVVAAVLYEGYILYPYRPSSVKNRQRWTFGGLYPQAYSQAQAGVEPSAMQTQCLLSGDDNTKLQVRVRFLHIMEREVRELNSPAPQLPDNAEEASHPVDSLRVGDKLYPTWQEATEREAGSAEMELGKLAQAGQRVSFAFPERHEQEALRSHTGEVVGLVVRRQRAVDGIVSLNAERIEGKSHLFKVTVRVENHTPWQADGATPRQNRDSAQLKTLVSTHTILGVQAGEFISLLDPPKELSAVAEGCSNVGTWPVLVGEEGTHDLILSSPIILYDYPQIAPESQGDLYDGTEIDEILTLRILTLTDEEKWEMRAVDERAGALLDRTEALTSEQLMRLHGSVRSLQVRQEGEE